MFLQGTKSTARSGCATAAITAEGDITLVKSEGDFEEGGDVDGAARHLRPCCAARAQVRRRDD
jgi:hypothetical protein